MNPDLQVLVKPFKRPAIYLFKKDWTTYDFLNSAREWVYKLSLSCGGYVALQSVGYKGTCLVEEWTIELNPLIITYLDFRHMEKYVNFDYFGFDPTIGDPS